MRKKQSSHNSVETKLEAVRQVMENKRPVAEVASELDLHWVKVNRWVISFKDNGEQGLVNPCSISQTSQSKDIKKTRELEKKLKEKEMEAEILKSSRPFSKGTNKQKIRSYFLFEKGLSSQSFMPYTRGFRKWLFCIS